MTSNKEQAWEHLSEVIASIEEVTDPKLAWIRTEMLMTTLGVVLADNERTRTAALVAYTLMCYASTHYSFLRKFVTPEGTSKAKALLLKAMKSAAEQVEEEDETPPEPSPEKIINTFGRTIMRSG